ncbi:hypothetical protein PoB_004751200 [Plakobranchus ocellatus]|uniref:Uncharacterized protein n=1 Tax=Plakobranchus ocellatus TaxID=259542 RepID=A0AAV4BNR7_9GAST|nr:hypothetical protein PoB_004751200 [Plakobranchus ocellatus]
MTSGLSKLGILDDHRSIKPWPPARWPQRYDLSKKSSMTSIAGQAVFCSFLHLYQGTSRILLFSSSLPGDKPYSALFSISTRGQAVFCSFLHLYQGTSRILLIFGNDFSSSLIKLYSKHHV